jgi:putative peptide zinc metalloprotease protein
MTTTANPASDLERRKSLRIRLRADLEIEAHKYEGRTFYVVKDPVSLRYYRLKDNEHFLLQFLDGKHTLEEAQKAYEKEYRPERLRLEDLEGFAQQLLTAGLALSDSPKAGKQLFERRGKRRRREFLQAFTNILYIKIPIFDPERILKWMLGYVGWIFSLWFFVLSVLFMLAAALLVLTHFDTFRAKIPDYHEFFSLKKAVYLWVALGVVKVIHEFGHGLSCKRFGGEVHEMGFLLMCLSPALYCNVSDAWILPWKWHRIIISAAGIYVELVIAAAATFVWWRAPLPIVLALGVTAAFLVLLRCWGGLLTLFLLIVLGYVALAYVPPDFLSNMAMSLMVVCSVSTFVFNANPLMRYDGYYVLADWLEIPNLREKSNRYLKNVVLDKCLGVEVPPEEYMELWRKVLFVSYAAISYLYRWFVTFAIIFVFGEFLKPYKLDIIAHMMKLAAIASMTIWPLYNLFKGIHRRGRLPDMKRARVLITGGAVVALLIFLCFVPVPISRIRGLALVQAHPESSSQIVLKRSALLDKLLVRPGDRVTRDAELAVFRDPELEEKLAQTQAELVNADEYLGRLMQQRIASRADPREQSRLQELIVQTQGKRETARASVEALERVKKEDLVIRAPRDGVIGQAPRVEDVGKMFEGRESQQQVQPIFTMHEPGKVRLCLPLETTEYHRLSKDWAELKQKSKEAGEEKQPWINLRVHGLDSQTWRGKIERLEESEAKYIPEMLSSRAGGPVAVQPPNQRSQGLAPQTQHYLVYLTIDHPDDAIAVGCQSQVKIYLQPETCLHWAWRKVNDLFNLRLI